MSVTIEAHADVEEFEFGRAIESIDGVRIELRIPRVYSPSHSERR